MKRADAINALMKNGIGMNYDQAKRHLTFLEKELKMAPPSLPEEYCQAIMHVYQDCYTFNQWEEDIEKDTKVMAALEMRRQWFAKKEDK